MTTTDEGCDTSKLRDMAQAVVVLVAHEHAAVALQCQPRDDVETRLDALAVLEALLARVSREEREVPVHLKEKCRRRAQEDLAAFAR